MAPTHVFPLPLYLRTGTGTCPYDCVRLLLPSSVSRLPSYLFRLPSCIFGQARGPVPTIACDCFSRLPSSLSRLPSPLSRLPIFPLIPSSIP